MIGDLDNLQHIGIVDTKLVDSKSVTEIELPARLNSLELGNTAIDAKMIKWLAKVPLSNLIIESCPIDQSASSGFSKLNQLVSLDLRRVNVNERLFRNLAELTSLRRMHLSVCKFKGEDYRRFFTNSPQGRHFQSREFPGGSGGSISGQC